MQVFENRYVQLSLLTIGIGLVFWAIIWIILGAVGIHDFPVGLQLAASFLGAGLIVYKYLSDRVF